MKLDFGKSGGMSLFIPRVEMNVTVDQVSYVFESLGVVRLVKFIKRIEKEYKMAYVYFEYWHDNYVTRDFQTKIQELSQLKVTHSGSRYWIVMPSKYWFQSVNEEIFDYELERLKEEHELQKVLLKKYREAYYNDSFEDIYNRDMRELLGCDDNSISS